MDDAFENKIDYTAQTCLSAVFRDEFILLNRLFDERAPPSNIRGSQKQVLKTPYDI